MGFGITLNSLGIPNNWMYPFPEQQIPEDESIALDLCEEDQLTLSAEDMAGNYIWNTGTTTATEEIFEGGTYWVQVNDGCFEAQRTFEVTEIEKPFLEITTRDDYVCEGDTVFVEVTTAAEWEWENGSSIPDTLFTTNVTTYLTLFEEQCMWQEDFLFEFQQRPTVELEEQFTFCEEETFLFEVDPTQGTTLIWSDGESDWIFESAQEGSHWVEITNSCGTERLDFETVSTFCTCDVFIPNAFTPDLNDLNENFKPVSTCPFVDYSFLIFNRWGEVIFETADPSDAWNGNVSGGKHYAQDEVYTYVLRYGLPNGDREEVYGSVIILS
ncbi:MAG: gliding motility-associated C-terminal domain-containing protein [Flavobacteriales bacterium]|nr:gliding motility-associated C-terminal domain-containing protein [Flavobacteriales bacterium]MDG2246845.1 gliding motility-associated C-terminal domain-containing protein [Flavobacteriales bacterium]